jgi:fatty-acyl-CoA synthase
MSAGKGVDDQRWTSATIVDMLDWATSVAPDRVAVIAGEQRLSYRELHDRVTRVSAGLQHHGIGEGDRVAIWLVNRPEWLIAYFAIARLGAVVVAVNTRSTGAECQFVLDDSGAKMLITQASFRRQAFVAMFESMCWDDRQAPSLVVVDPPAGSRHLSFAAVELAGSAPARAGTLRFPTLSPDDPFLILYTSGTTSAAKGVLLTHRNVVRNHYWAGERQRFTERDRLLVILPLFSAFNCVNGLIAIMTHAGSMVLLPAFDPVETMAVLVGEECTAMYGVDTVFRDIIDCPQRSEYDLSALRTGSGLLSPPMARAIRHELGVTEYCQVYGMTECGAVATMNSVTDSDEVRFTTIGHAMPDVAIRIVDPATRDERGDGEIGEITVRGYTVMQGYLGNEPATKAAIDDDGWLHTGDLAERTPGGDLVFRGRIKEMLKPGGFNVSSLEVEDVIRAHPAVQDAAVVGVPDERLMEAGFAFVRRKPGADVTAEELSVFCKQRMAGFKVPSHFRFTESEFPRNALGKVEKLQLRASAIRQLGLDVSA